jgi:hypothetical protein
VTQNAWMAKFGILDTKPAANTPPSGHHSAPKSHYWRPWKVHRAKKNAVLEGPWPRFCCSSTRVPLKSRVRTKLSCTIYGGPRCSPTCIPWWCSKEHLHERETPTSIYGAGRPRRAPGVGYFRFRGFAPVGGPNCGGVRSYKATP